MILVFLGIDCFDQFYYELSTFDDMVSRGGCLGLASAFAGKADTADEDIENCFQWRQGLLHTGNPISSRMKCIGEFSLSKLLPIFYISYLKTKYFIC